MNNKYKFALSLFAISIIIISSFYLKNFRIDASSDTLVAQNDNDFEFFNYYQEVFPTKNSLVVAIQSKKIIDYELLNEVNDITNKISALPEVNSIFNINKAPILFLNNTSLIDLSNSKFETILDTNLELNSILEEFAKSPIYSNQIINDKKNTTSLIIFLEDNEKIIDLKKNKDLYLIENSYYSKKSEIDEDRKKLISKIRVILGNSNKDYNYYLGGIEMISNDVITFVKKDILVFSSLVILLVIFILFIIFKKIKWVLTVLIPSIFAVYIMIGLIGFLQFEITAVSANFISLMFILSISMNIHILNYFLQSNNNLNGTLKNMFWPCFYTFLTTVVAFFSLVLSDIKPVIDFGLVMIISLVIILISAFSILPLLISFVSQEKETIKKLNFKIIQDFFKFSNKFKKHILIFNLSIFIIAIYGISKLNVENSFIKYFKKNTEIYQGMKLIDSELGGTTPLDIIIKIEDDLFVSTSKNENNNDEDIEFDDLFSDDIFENETKVWFTENKIETIKKIHEYLESRHEIGKVVSIYSLINVANKINKNKLSPFELEVLYSEIPQNYKEDLILPYLNIEKNLVKISARIKDSENIQRGKLIREVKNFTVNSFTNIEDVKINGILVLYNNMLSSLFSSQIKSLGFVILAIFFMFLVLFRSIKLSIVGIIPNIFASTFILGIIGLLNIPLDIMTITIAAISIGIAVDNTIHYLYKYKLNLSKYSNYIDSIKETHLTVGYAVLTTSLAISLGFLVLCFSNFVPTIIFGLFTSLAMIFAMIGVLITLPSILNYLR